MNIFDPLISGSLSVSGSGEISGDLTVLGTINGNISGTTTNAISASHAAAYLLTSSFGAFTSSYTTGSFTGSFGGDGSNLINIPASGVTGLNLTQIADGSVTASVSSANGLRVNSNTEITGALTITGSITLNGVPVGTGKLDEIVFNAYSSSNNTTNSLQNGRLDALEGSTSSLNTFTSSATSRLNTIETTTGSLNTFTSSASDKLIYLESTTSSLNTFTSSANGRLNSLETASGSIRTDFNTYTSSNNTVIGTIQTTTSSLNSFTSSANGRLSSLESTTSSLNSYTSSNNNRLGVIETTTGSLNSFTSSASGRLSSLEASSGSIRTDFNTYTSSNDSTNSTQNGKLSALETSSGSLNSFTTSINSKIGSIEISTSSLNSFTSSINTTIKNKLDSDNVISGSIQVSITGTSGFTSFSSSIAAIDSAQDVRLTSIEGITGSYATTGSNIFQGNQVITGSLFVSQDLIIAGSSSIQNISSSVLNIADNIITVNALNPSVRFGGLAVIDSGSSPQVSGSILFDSVNNQWLFVHQNQGTLTSSVLLMGPETYNNIGNETYVTANRLVKSTGIEHLTDSNISDNGTTVTILSNAVVNGTFSATGTTLVSGSSQIDHNATTNYVANRHIDHTSVSITTLAGSGLTGGGDITTTRDLSIATGGVTNAMLAGSIENGKLTNSSLTIGSTAISLGGSSATLGGLTSVTSTAFTGSLQGSISGNAATVTTNANLTGVVTSTGNATTIANGNITNAMLGGSIANDKLVNSSFHIGTTSISLGRASAAQTLTGVSIDGNATSETLSTVVARGATTTATISVGNFSTGATGLNIRRGRLCFSDSYEPNHSIYNNYLNIDSEGQWDGMKINSFLGLDIRTGDNSVAATIVQVRPAGVTITGSVSATNLSGTNTGDQTLSGLGGQPQLNGTGFVKAAGTTISYDNNTYYLASNPSNYISSYTETSTLQNVISRGATTNTGFVIENGNSTYSTPASTNVPVIYMHNTSSNENAHAVLALRTLGPTGGDPFVSFDINGVLGWTVGIDNSDADKFKIGKSWATVGTNTYFTIDTSGNSVFAGTISATNFSGTSSGTNTGDQTLSGLGGQPQLNGTGFVKVAGTTVSYDNSTYYLASNPNNYISSYTETDTLASVTGRGASTSTAISINNTLTVTSGRIIARTGGANTYGVFSGYDNNNHMMAFRSAISGPTATPTFTAGHQTTFVEYAEAGDATGWYFKSSSSGTYEEIVRITRTGVIPGTNGSQNLGSSSARWNTLFTSDLSLSNGIGDYTIVEGENDLFLYNNKQNKVYKFMLQEVNASDATPKRPE
jgi:trimeric autotransporter adhesin